MNIASRKVSGKHGAGRKRASARAAGSAALAPRHTERLMWALLAVFAIVWLFALDLRTLMPPDEGRYAEMAREMWASGDWITTRLNGIKYFEKPPLQTWMNALTFTLFGLGEWQARLWTGLCAMLGIAATGYAGGRLFGRRAGLYAALVLGSSLYWVVAGQVDSIDMGLSSMMTITLCALLLAQRDGAAPSERRNWMLVCWAGMALAMLAKGLIGIVLPGGVLVLYTLATRDWALWRRLHLAKGLLLLFAIATPWFVLVGLANPEQPHFFFVHEHWDRFLHDDHHRTGAWYYFVPALLLGIVPWLGLLPASVTAAMRPQTGRFQPRLLLLIWAGFIFFFFSYSHSKLPGYIVPIFPALALLVALRLETAGRGQRLGAAALLTVFGIVLLAVVPFVPGFAKDVADIGLMRVLQPYVLAAGLVALAGGLLALVQARRLLLRDLSVLTMALAGFASTQLLLAGVEPFGQQRAGVLLVPAIEGALQPDSTLYSVGAYDQSLPFYLKRTVTLVDYWDEFTFGLEQQPALSIPTVDGFVAIWQRHAAAGITDVALIRSDIYQTLQQRGIAMRVVVRDAHRIVVTNR